MQVRQLVAAALRGVGAEPAPRLKQRQRRQQRRPRNYRPDIDTAVTDIVADIFDRLVFGQTSGQSLTSQGSSSLRRRRSSDSRGKRRRSISGSGAADGIGSSSGGGGRVRGKVEALARQLQASGGSCGLGGGVGSSGSSNVKVVKGCKVTLGAGAANNSNSGEDAGRKASGSVEAPPAAKPGQCRQQ